MSLQHQLAKRAHLRVQRSCTAVELFCTSSAPQDIRVGTRNRWSWVLLRSRTGETGDAPLTRVVMHRGPSPSVCHPTTPNRHQGWAADWLLPKSRWSYWLTWYACWIQRIHSSPPRVHVLSSGVGWRCCIASLCPTTKTTRSSSKVLQDATNHSHAQLQSTSWLF